MEVRSERSRQLLKRMVLHEPKLRVPDKASEVRDNNRAVKMIILAACLDYAMVDLECELTNAGLFRQQVKKSFNMANRLVMDCHNVFYNMLANKNFEKAKKQYLQHSDNTWQAICEGVLPNEPLEGAYNRVLSLCRLTLKYNEELRGRYDCYCVDKLATLPRLISGLGIKDYNLDFLIESKISYK